MMPLGSDADLPSSGNSQGATQSPEEGRRDPAADPHVLALMLLRSGDRAAELAFFDKTVGAVDRALAPHSSDGNEREGALLRIYRQMRESVTGVASPDELETTLHTCTLHVAASLRGQGVGFGGSPVTIVDLDRVRRILAADLAPVRLSARQERLRFRRRLVLGAVLVVLAMAVQHAAKYKRGRPTSPETPKTGATVQTTK